MAVIRPAESKDIAALLPIDLACFPYDAMSKRSFRRFIQHEHADFVVVENAGEVIGYAILLFRQATRSYVAYIPLPFGPCAPEKFSGVQGLVEHDGGCILSVVPRAEPCLLQFLRTGREGLNQDDVLEFFHWAPLAYCPPRFAERTTNGDHLPLRRPGVTKAIACSPTHVTASPRLCPTDHHVQKYGRLPHTSVDPASLLDRPLGLVSRACLRATH